MSPPGFGRFFLPGPTEVRPEILEAQVEPMIGHRGPDIVGLVSELQEGLKGLFRTERPVLISTSSATGLMEAAIRNGVGKGVGDRVLCLVNGAFSERFHRIAAACGRTADRLDVAWGEVHDPEAVRRRLAEGGYDAVTVVHSETSTGALQPLEGIAAAVGESEAGTLLLVDSVTGIGGAPLETDGWGLDFVLTGSQKALALPPGLAFAAWSETMIERARTVPDRGVYFDLDAFASNLDKAQTPNTPALSLMYAARAQLRRIAEEGVEARWERHRAMAERCVEWVGWIRESRGVELGVLAGEGRRSPTVTCITLPEGARGSEVARAMRARGFVIGAGYGRLKEASIRIGHMGDHTLAELNALLEELEEVLVG